MAAEIKTKGPIMITQTRTAASSKRTPVKEDAKWWKKHQSIPFRPRATLLLDVSPENSISESTAGELPEGMLNQLLINTEASAGRTQSAMRKWQLVALISGMLLVPMVLISIMMYSEMNTIRTHRARLEIENDTLQDRLNTAGMQISGFRNKIESLAGRNTELTRENKTLKSTSIAPPAVPVTATASATAAVTKQTQPKRLTVPKVTPDVSRTSDTKRVDAIKKGKYPSDATKAEIIAALGKPDRVYKSTSYEQWVYFDRNPGRFWFVGKWLVEVSQ